MKDSIVIAALGLSFLAAEALAQPEIDYGKDQYESNCASCHGLTGKGDGPLSHIFRPKATDLTTLAKRNDGVFPAQLVYEIIDGRKEVEAHGPRAMPVWGRDYLRDVPDLYQLEISDFRGAIANAKIVALVDYLHRIQEN